MLFHNFNQFGQYQSCLILCFSYLHFGCVLGQHVNFDNLAQWRHGSAPTTGQACLVLCLGAIFRIIGASFFQQGGWWLYRICKHCCRVFHVNLAESQIDTYVLIYFSQDAECLIFMRRSLLVFIWVYLSVKLRKFLENALI